VVGPNSHRSDRLSPRHSHRQRKMKGLKMTFVFQTVDDPNATHGTVVSGVDKNGDLVGF